MDDLSNDRSADRINKSGFYSAIVTSPESIPDQHSVQLQGKSIIDDDGVHFNIRSNTSPFFDVELELLTLPL